MSMGYFSLSNSKPNGIRRMARLAFANKLFTPSSRLEDLLRQVVRLDCMVDMVLAYVDRTVVVGVAILTPEHEAFVFVDHNYRRVGIGTGIALHLERHSEVPRSQWTLPAQTPDSSKFWQQLLSRQNPLPSTE